MFVTCWLLLACSPERNGGNAPGEAHLPAFVEVTGDAGLAGFRHDNDMDGKMFFPEQMGSGGGFLDYNSDGWLDIVLVGGGTLQYETHPTDSALFLYRNNGDETFSLVTKEAGLGGLPNLYGIGVACADYDNDGDSDLFYTTIRENFLFRNDNGKFTNITELAGINGPVLWSSSAIFFDADKDGWLDLFVCNYADWSPETDIVCKHSNGKKVYCSPTVYHGVPSTYYHNNGDGTFTDRTFESGFWPFKGRERAKGENAPGKSLGVTEIDFNRDTWPDLVIANDGEGDLLYVNQGDGTFSEEGMYAGFAYAENGEARAGMGITAGVTDTSGLVSIFVGNFSSEMIGVYQYTENGWFRDRSSVSKIGRASLKALTFGLFLQDLDFDGDFDLFAANGHVYPMKAKFGTGVEYKQESQIYLNDGYGTFELRNDDIGGVIKKKMVARAAAYGDYNNDGLPDILLTENGGPVHLWRNEFPHANFLRIELAGQTGNRDGFGAEIIAVVGKNRYYRRVHGSASYLSVPEKIATFGLGKSTRVDSLIVTWPSGQRNILTNLPAGQLIKLTENKAEFASLRYNDQQ